MKAKPLDRIPSDVLGKTPGVVYREGIIRDPLSYQVHFDFLLVQYLAVGTYPVPQECPSLTEHLQAEWGQGPVADKKKMALWS